MSKATVKIPVQTTNRNTWVVHYKDPASGARRQQSGLKSYEAAKEASRALIAKGMRWVWGEGIDEDSWANRFYAMETWDGVEQVVTHA